MAISTLSPSARAPAWPFRMLRPEARDLGHAGIACAPHPRLEEVHRADKGRDPAVAGMVIKACRVSTWITRPSAITATRSRESAPLPGHGVTRTKVIPNCL